MSELVMIDEPLSRESKIARAQSEIGVRRPAEAGGRWGGFATGFIGLLIVFANVFAFTAVLVAFASDRFDARGGLGESPVRASEFFARIASDGFYGSIAAAIAATFCVGMILAVTRMRVPDHRSYLGLRKTKLFPTVGWAAGIVILQTFWLIAPRFGIGEEISQYVVDIYRTGEGRPTMWITYVVLIPAYEELFARGFLFAGWERSKLGAFWTILLTTAFWTAMHANYNVLELTQVASAGLLFGMARWHTGSIFPAVVMHAVVNCLALYHAAQHVPVI